MTMRQLLWLARGELSMQRRRGQTLLLSMAQIVYGFVDHGRVTENLATNFYLINARQENVADNGVGEITALAVITVASHAESGMGAGDHKIAIGYGAAYFSGKLAECLAHFLMGR